MDIPIIFENSDLLVINKPSGLMVHSDGKTEKETLVDWIVVNRPEIRGVGEPMAVDGKVLDRPGIVHRLDEETSGVMVIAKNQPSFEYLKAQFQAREVHKIYHAFVWGHFKETAGIVNEPIGRNRNDFRKWHAGKGVRGETRNAITKWEVMEQFSDSDGQQFSFVRLSPETGRTHQLRVHMKYIQRPIVADRLYAPSAPKALGFDRVALHAKEIAFKAPSGEQISLESPYPQDFKDALAKAGLSC